MTLDGLALAAPGSPVQFGGGDVGVGVGVMFANGARSAEPAHAAELARHAEAAAYESLWAVQHVVVPVQHESRYPYSQAGTIPGGPFVPVPEPLAWLACVAAVTTRIRLATGVLILPQQRPLVVAKQAATLDRLCGGRLVLGVGAGWLREEFDTLDAAFDGRGPRLDEAIGVMRRAWAGRVVVSPGPAYQHGPVAVEPKPVLLELGVTRVIVNVPHAETALLAERLAERLEHVRGLLPVTVPA
jgi:alkanesulfonate monooxygenase SsuD/methylene tetrahydromethanopterin reductase-like flavin-dependent oxidoreductase (luciferase family)